MRWGRPTEGDKRQRKFFAWTPVTIPNIHGIMERRWWEWVTVEQIYREDMDFGLPTYGSYWETVRFLD